jgi:hypothetical protein
VSILSLGVSFLEARHWLNKFVPKETSWLLSTLTAAWISRPSRCTLATPNTTQRYIPHLPEIVSIRVQCG